MSIEREFSSFVGRSSELAELGAAVDGGARLVLITGAAGVGKSRLARELALERRAGARVVAVELESAAHADAIAPAVALALELPVANLDTALAASPLLLLLDGCDAVIDGVLGLASRWLPAAPALTIVVTSRVAPEALPEDAGVLALGPLSVDDDGDGERLFRERAAQLRPGSPLAPGERDAVRAIVRRLGGLPLAIELAASWLSVLGTAQLLGELEAGPLRQDLERVLERSWALLDAAEQAVLGELSCFRDGCDLDAIRAVSSLGGAELMRCLRSLQRQSLLRCFQPGGLPGVVRYDLLAPIRALAKARVDAVEWPLLCRRHADHFLARRPTNLGDDALRMRHAALDLANLGAAFDRALAGLWSSGPDLGRAARATAALEPLVKLPGVARRAVEQAAALTAHPDFGELELDQRAAVRDVAATGYVQLGDAQRARASLDAIAAVPENPALRASLCARRGFVAWLEGDAEGAIAAYREALAGDPDRVTRGKLHVNLAVALRHLGRLTEAAEALERALEHHRAAGQQAGAAAALQARASLAIECGRLDEAERDFERALLLFRRLGELRQEGITLAFLGFVHQERGLLDDAERELRAALDCQRRQGNRQHEALALAMLGDLVLDRGDAEAAAAHLHEALRRAGDSGDEWSEALSAILLAAAELGRGRANAARRAMERAAAAGVIASEPRLAAALALVRILDAASSTDAAAIEAARAELQVLAQRFPNDARPSFLRPLFRRAMAALERGPGGEDGLIADAQGRWFRVGAGEPVDLSRREVLRRMLEALLEARRQRPGEPLDLEALRQAGWPGEAMVADAISNRVYVAIATLRRLGLRSLLVTGGGGYFLDPAVPLRSPAGGSFKAN